MKAEKITSKNPTLACSRRVIVLEAKNQNIMLSGQPNLDSAFEIEISAKGHLFRGK